MINVRLLLVVGLVLLGAVPAIAAGATSGDGPSPAGEAVAVEAAARSAPQRATPPDATRRTAPSRTAPPQSPRYEPVTTSRAAIRITGARGSGVLTRIRETDGVRHAAAVRIGRVRLGSTAGGPAVLVAAADPVTLRRLVPQPTADSIELWRRLDEGDAAVTHERAGQLDLALGAYTEIGGTNAVPVRVGALASNGTPPIADMLVNRDTGARLGLDAVDPTVLVSVDDEQSADTVADRLDGRVDADIEVIPDPRQVYAVTQAQQQQAATVWDVLALCESSGNWATNTGNGFYGGLQFLPESWRLVGGTGMPHEATREEQIFRAERLLAIQGWEAWPVCSVKLGLRPPPPDWGEIHPSG